MAEFEKFKNGCEIAVSKDHTFGTDAFLLADFARVRHKDIVCDLCTGCGIIAVLTKIRYAPAFICGIDIQEAAVEQFKLTISRSGFLDMSAVHMDLKELSEPAPLGICDCVTCNPPYKAEKAGIESLSEAHRIARHEILCNINDVCCAANKLLKFGGSFYLCNRPERLADVVSAMRVNNIEPKTIRFVSKTPKDPPWLFLIEGKKGGKPFLKVMQGLYMEDSGGLSKEMLEIYGKTQP